MWLGLGLATVGGGLLAREFGLLPAEVRLVDFWPLVLLFAGISSLLRARGFLGALFALAFVALGGLLLAGNLGLVHFPAARLWPGLLVLLGIAFLIGGAQSSRRRPPPTDSFGGASGGRNLATGERFDKQVTFAGLELKIESQAWRGGELGVTAGGVELDLRYARLAPEGALLDVRILMGGVDIRVPDTWQVKNDVTPLLGGADDSTRSTQGSTDAPLLRVVGSVTLGGISIHN
jgi:hypothetical protein